LKRTVTIDLRTLTDAPFAEGAEVTFTLRRNSYTAQATYQKDTVTAVTDAQGVATAELWCNAEGMKAAKYICGLPSGEFFPFTLPAGDGAISVEALRAAGETPFTQSNEAAFQGLINSHAEAEALARAVADSVFVLAVAENTTLDIGDALRALILIDTTAGDVTVTLQPLADMAGREIVFMKTADDNLAIVDGDGSELINGALVFNLEMLNQFIGVMPGAGQWRVVRR
jgi:hypothetical protein